MSAGFDLRNALLKLHKKERRPRGTFFIVPGAIGRGRDDGIYATVSAPKLANLKAFAFNTYGLAV
jgi:hypothetical protein